MTRAFLTSLERVPYSMATAPTLLPLHIAAHDLCERNRAAIQADGNRAACFCCCQFVYGVDDWCDEGDDERAVTGVCPKCGIDALLSRTLTINGVAVAVSMELLLRMADYWFGVHASNKRAHAIVTDRKVDE